MQSCLHTSRKRGRECVEEKFAYIRCTHTSFVIKYYFSITNQQSHQLLLKLCHQGSFLQLDRRTCREIREFTEVKKFSKAKILNKKIDKI